MVRCAFRKASSTSCAVGSKTDVIWINDDLLQQSWRRFIASRNTRQSSTKRHASTLCAVHSSDLQHHKCADHAVKRKRLVIRNDLPYGLRHGSSTPGPLEARRRCGLKRHMMDVAPADYMGGTISVRALMRLGKDHHHSTKDDPEDLRNFNWETRLVAAVRDVFVYLWRLRPRLEFAESGLQNEIVSDDVVHAPIESAYKLSYKELLETLSEHQSSLQQQKPKDIADLVIQCMSAPPKTQEWACDILEKWIKTEVSLGNMPESSIQSLLKSFHWEKTSWARPENQVPWNVCLSIWDGITASTVRQVHDMGFWTIRYLLRAVIQAPAATVREKLAIDIIKGIGERSPQQAALHLRLFLRTLLGDSRAVAENISFLEGEFQGRLETLMQVLQNLPFETTVPAVTRTISNLVSESADNSLVKRQIVFRWIRALLIKLSESQLINESRADKNWQAAWSSVETKLWFTDVGCIGAYFYSDEESEVCRYVKYHLLDQQGRMLADTRNREDIDDRASLELHKVKASWFPSGDDSESDHLSYIGLISWTAANNPEKMKPLLRFLFALLRHMNRPRELHQMVYYLFKYQKRGRNCLPISVFFQEMDRWVSRNPILVLNLISMDDRPEAVMCPAIPRALEKARRVSIHTLLRLLDQLSSLYDPDLDHALPLSNYSGGIFQLLALRLAFSSHQSVRSPKHIIQIVQLFKNNPELVKPMLGAALTKAVIVNRLLAKQEIRPEHLNWVAPWIRRTEKRGWFETSAAAKDWWKEIIQDGGAEKSVWRPVWNDNNIQSEDPGRR